MASIGNGQQKASAWPLPWSWDAPVTLSMRRCATHVAHQNWRRY